MHQIKTDYLDYQAYRMMRPDWRRYVRPNSELAAFYERIERKYRPDQPRVPAGVPEGGQWTDDDRNDDSHATDQGGEGHIRIAQVSTGTLTDALGEPYYRPGGHHEAPRAVYDKWNLPPETRQVFKEATTGTVPELRIRTSPDGTPQGHLWNKAHFEYNEAVRQLGDRFLEKNRITPEQMTPDHAREMPKEIRESRDPRIRDYNQTIRLIRRIYRLRTGRGME